MSNAVFPTLPGLTWNVRKEPTWKTKIQESVSGKELRAAWMSYPNWRFSLSYEVLRANALAELQSLVGFFNARAGAFDSFLYHDPDDNSVTNYQFGTGDGSTKDFQLVRSYGGFVEPVQNLNGSPSIYKAGVLQAPVSDYNLGATGIVSFVTAPANGAALTWTGNFYYRVRFAQDRAEFNQFLYQLWELKKLEFISVKL
jgi:uncharacterized protein (TIGR02217 family)